MATVIGTLEAVMTMNNRAFIQGMNEAERRVNTSSASMVGSLKNIGIAAAALGTSFAALGTGIVFTAAVAQASKFETAMADLVKVTDESFESIKTSIQSIDPALGSSTELVQGYYQTISAGVTEPAEALEFLTTASRFAKAAHIEQAEAVEVLAKMMNGYEGDLKSATEAADLLFAIEAKGIVQVKALTPIIGELAAQSKSMAVETHEMGGALAHLTKVSGSASEAGTKYQAVLTALRKGNTHLKEAYKKLGVTSGQALIKQRGFIGALQALKKHAESGGKSLGDLFTRVEAITGSIILSKDNFDTLNDTISEVEDSTGGLERAFEAYEETLGAVTDKIKNQLGNTLAKLGEETLPGLKEALEGFSDWWVENEEPIINSANMIFEAIRWGAESAATQLAILVGILDEIHTEFKYSVERTRVELENYERDYESFLNTLSRNEAFQAYQKNMDSLYQSTGGLIDLRINLDDFRSSAEQTTGTLSSFSEVVDHFKSQWKEFTTDAYSLDWGKWGDGLEDAADNVGDLGDATKEAAEALKLQSEIYSSLTDETDEFLDNIVEEVNAQDKLTKKMDEYSQAANIARIKTEGYVDSWMLMARATKKVNVDELKRKLKNVTDEIGKQEVELRGMARAWEEVNQRIKDFDFPYEVMTGAFETMSSGISQVAKHYAFELGRMKEEAKTTFEESKDAALTAYTEQMEALEASYAAGTISTKEFEERRLELKKNYDEKIATANQTYQEDLKKAERSLGDNLEDIWEDFLGRILDKVAQFVVDVLAHWAKLKVMKALGLGDGGGFSLGSMFSGGGAAGAGGINWGTVGGAAGAYGMSGYTAAEIAAMSGSSWAGAGAAPAMHGATGGMSLGSMAGPLAVAGVGAVIVSGIAKMLSTDASSNPVNVLNDMRKQIEKGTEQYSKLTEQIRATQGYSEDLFKVTEKISKSFDFTGKDFKFDVVMGQLQQAFKLNSDNEMAIEVVANLIDNASTTFEQKMQALHMIGSAQGWTSDVTLSMIGKFVDSGVALDDIIAILEQTGVSPELTRKIEAILAPITADQESFNYWKMDPGLEWPEGWNINPGDPFNDLVQRGWRLHPNDSWDKIIGNDWLIPPGEDWPKDWVLPVTEGPPGWEIPVTGIPDGGIPVNAPSSIPVTVNVSGRDSFDQNSIVPQTGHAAGGFPSPGELTWVGEKGPELAYFGSGGRVWSNHDSMKIADSWAKGFFPGAAADGLGGGLGSGVGGLSSFGYDRQYIRRLFNNFLMEPDMTKFPKDFKFGYEGPTTSPSARSSSSSINWDDWWTGNPGQEPIRVTSGPDGPPGKRPEIHIHNEIGGREVNKQVVSLAEGVVKTYSDRGLKRHNLMT